MLIQQGNVYIQVTIYKSQRIVSFFHATQFPLTPTHPPCMLHRNYHCKIEYLSLGDKLACLHFDLKFMNADISRDNCTCLHSYLQLLWYYLVGNFEFDAERDGGVWCNNW